MPLAACSVECSALRLLLLAGLSLTTIHAAEQTISYNFVVRPILAENCFACHGPDEKHREGKLRLDIREAALEKKAFVPGDATNSELVKRIFTTDEDDVMPPKKSNHQLTAEQKDLLVRWVNEGAAYAKHWSFTPPEKPPVPEVADAFPGGRHNEIDALVQAKLTEHNMRPTGPAAKELWLRRVSLALTGLPPTLAELDAFVADASPTSRETVINRLLESPRYGERMAVDWMDAARYADTYGRHEDADCQTWPWRDWVIRAFNQNLPYSTFIAWQTAGDLLEPDNQDAVVATAFNRLHQQSNESGSDENEFRWEHVFDRVKTNATAIMGVTMECARCHDHKYDPFTMRDYYSMASFFNNIDELGLFSRFTNANPAPTTFVYGPGQKEAHEALKDAVIDAEQKVTEARGGAHRRFAEWLKEHAPPGTVPKPEGVMAKLGSLISGEREAADPVAPISYFPFDKAHKEDKSTPDMMSADRVGKGRTSLNLADGKFGKAVAFRGLKDNQILIPGMGEFSRADGFTLSIWVKSPQPFDHVVLLHRTRAGLDAGNRGYELTLEHGRLTGTLAHFYPGNAIRTTCKEPLASGEWMHLAMTYDGSGKAAGIGLFVNGVRQETEIIRDNLYKDIAYRLEWGDFDTQKVADAEMAEAVQFQVGGRYLDTSFAGGLADELKVFDRELSEPEICELAQKTVSPDDGAWFEWYVREIDVECMEAEKKLHDARVTANQFTLNLVEVMVMKEWDGPRRPTPMLDRGQFSAPKELVGLAVPEFLLPFPPAAAKNRRGLAEWLTDPRHPLTGRVEVNRVWKMFFGRGLVATAEDFGIQGSLPSHPELLDWLTCWFTEHDWDVKALCRLIALSATYGQDSLPAEKVWMQEDPDNVWLAHGPRFRLPAEQIRDSTLAISGLLKEERGGPSVHPYQPEGLWEDAGTQHSYTQDHGDGLYRRSLYTFWRRTCPPPVMSVFDAPTREFCRVRRDTTLTPQQGLALENETGFLEAGRVFAENLVRQHPGAEKATVRLDQLFRMMTGVLPTTGQRESLLRLAADARTYYSAHRDDAVKLITVGEHPVDASLDPVEVAGMMLINRAMTSYDAFLCSY